MSKIQITELQETKSELNLLNDNDTNAVVGGYGDFGGVNIAVPIQINNNINLQFSLFGDNYSYSNQSNNSGIGQS
jgi:hypothetical protein